MKTYRGSAAAARNYVETGRARADDYYLTEGSGIAEHYGALPHAGVRHLAPLSGDAYEAWVAGCDPETGEPKGRLRNDENAVRFVEIGVNGPKSWSLAAELHPDISAAYDAAQDRAAEQILGWLAQHATTRVGARGAQVQVPVAAIEAVTVRHYTSRAGDPHRHLHLQVNARVFAEGRWRGLHTVGVRDSLDALNGIGHAAVMTDPGFRAALAAHGFTLDPDTGEIVELSQFVGPFSARAEQIGRNIDRYEAEWRAANPGQEPGHAVRRAWDARAWADARPDKINPSDGADLTRRWVSELHELGYRDVHVSTPVGAVPVAHLDRDGAVAEVLSRLAARRSGWNGADIRGQVEQLIARRNLVTDTAVRSELAEDLTARTLAQCVGLLDRVGVPEHIRALTSPRVLALEADLTARLAARASVPSTGRDVVHDDALTGLDIPQRAVVSALAGGGGLVVVEGAAGAGKTTTLAATRTAVEQAGHRLVVVTPTLKAAHVAARQLGTRVFSAARLAHQHGYRWSADGTWTRLAPGQLDPATGAVYREPSGQAQLQAGDLLLCDEAGMLDQDTARALLTLADEHHVRVAFVGDRHQLPAVGRGGVLDLAARWADPDACLTLDRVHRFTRTIAAPDGTVLHVADDEYARLSLAMRGGSEPGDVFDRLRARGQITVHASDAERLAALTEEAVDALINGSSGVVLADTREQVAALNAAVRDRLVAAGRVDDEHATITDAGQRIAVGDRVVTRRNNPHFGVANRDAWTVTHVASNGQIIVRGTHGDRTLPADYVREQVELGYASTVYGAQGETTSSAHLLLGEHTTAASAYVAMTRGRNSNVAYLVADRNEDAREQWIATFARERADLGPAHAADLAAQQAARYARLRPLDQVLAELHDAWTAEHESVEELARLEQRRDVVTDVLALTRQRDAVVPGLKQAYSEARLAAADATTQADRIEAVVAAHATQIADQLKQDWDSQRDAARHAAQIVCDGPGRLGQRHWAVNRAIDELGNWSARWQPYLPTMPTRTEHIVAFAGWYDHTPAIHDAFDRYGRGVAEHAHPELEDARSAAEAATTVRDQAWQRSIQASGHYDLQLSRCGSLNHHPHLEEYLTELHDTIPTVRAKADTATDRVQRLLAEPTLRTLPPDRIDAERDQWRADRDASHALSRHPLNAFGRGAEHLALRSSYEPYDREGQPAQHHSRGISR